MAQVPPTVRRQVTAYMDNFYSNKTAFNEEVRAGVPPAAICLSARQPLLAVTSRY